MLRRLWSPTNLFDSIEFHAGLNIIIGRYAENKRQRDIPGINGIGKSSVVRLIDFALLSDSAEKRFALEKYSFLREEAHEVSLLLDVRGESISIRRAFSGYQMIYIQRGDGMEFAYKKDEAYRLLSGLFFPENEERQLPGGRYRSLMQFFIKDDLAIQSRKDPLGFISHSGVTKLELITLNLFLLGLPNKDIIAIGEKRDFIARKQTERKTVVERVEQFSGKSLAELKTEVASREKDIRVVEQALERFELLGDFKSVSETIDDLETRISALRTSIDRSDRQLAKLRRFTTATKEVDADDVAEQYRLVSHALGDAVRRSLEDVLAFRESLAEARLRFHGKRMREMEEGRATAFAKLSKYELERAALLRAVEGADTVNSLKGAFERYASSRVELERVSLAISEISTLDQVINNIAFEMDAARRDAVQAITSAEESIAAIRELFVDIVDRAIGFTTQNERDGAYLDVTARLTGGRNQIPVDIVVEVPKQDALGYARLRLVAYDMTVFLNAVDRGIDLPRFLFHDGAFHGIARRTVVRALNYIHQKSRLDRSFQYIVTFNEDELSATSEEQVRDGKFDFDIEEQTVLTVSDSIGGMLFRRQFA